MRFSVVIEEESGAVLLSFGGISAAHGRGAGNAPDVHGAEGFG